MPSIFVPLKEIQQRLTLIKGTTCTIKALFSDLIFCLVNFNIIPHSQLLYFIFVLCQKGNNVSKTLFLSFITSLLFVFSLLAQNNTIFIDDLAFPCVHQSKSISSQIPHSLLIEIDKISDIQQTVASLKSSIRTAKDEIILWAFLGEYEEEILKAELEKQFKNSIYFHNKGSDWPSLDSLKTENKEAVAIFKDDLTYTSTEQVKNTNIYSERFSKDPFDKLVIFKPNSMDSLYHECLSLWKTTGKVPNLVILAVKEVLVQKSALDSLNSLRRFKGVFLHNNEYLNEIYWKQKPKLITPAKFSYPLTGYQEILSPYKNGYKITPGEILHHTGMIDAPRTFNAYDTDLNDKLVMHFPFNGSLENLIEPSWKNTISENIEFVKDSEKGTVIQFKGNNSFVDYSKENNLSYNSPITVSAWIRPNSLDEYMGIIGFGNSFSLKLNNGKPDFTTAGIKDHLVNKQIAINEWSHISVVFTPNSIANIYINGKEMAVVDASEIESSNQSLLIGTNIWGEQFIGAIDELKIWDRGLSEKEIEAVYLAPNSADKKKSSKIYAAITGLVILLLGFITYTILFRKKERPAITNTLSKIETSVPVNRIQLFGTFQVRNAPVGDITNQFSPLLRQMLAFFILNSAESPDGISVKKISDTFWPGAPKDKAKENRGTNIKKLKKILEDIDGLSISYEKKRWYLLLNDQLQIDYILFKELKENIQNQLKSDSIDSIIISKLLNILQHGNILQNIEKEWLDSYKNNISNEVIELLQEILPKLNKLIDIQIETAKTIQQFDQLNEEALKFILTALSLQGNHGQAQQVYDDFCKKYAHLYNEKFPLTYTEIVKK